MQHFIKDKPKCPDVALGSVRLGLEDLGRHVQRTAHCAGDLVGFVFFLGETEVADFCVPFL
jgi:hypothetical protein